MLKKVLKETVHPEPKQEEIIPEKSVLTVQTTKDPLTLKEKYDMWVMLLERRYK